MTDEERIKALDQVVGRLGRVATRLRETAEELKAGKIHPMHAANRIAKIVREIEGGRDDGNGDSAVVAEQADRLAARQNAAVVAFGSWRSGRKGKGRERV